MTAPEFAPEFQAIYDGEINVEISWFRDGGIDIRLGDKVNGSPAEQNVRSVAEIVPWLQEAIAHFYAESAYARSLSPEIRGRLRVRSSLRRAGVQVICPHCGGPHAALPGMDERIGYVCLRGTPVKVERPKVQ